MSIPKEMTHQLPDPCKEAHVIDDYSECLYALNGHNAFHICIHCKVLKLHPRKRQYSTDILLQILMLVCLDHRYEDKVKQIDFSTSYSIKSDNNSS